MRSNPIYYIFIFIEICGWAITRDEYAMKYSEILKFRELFIFAILFCEWTGWQEHNVTSHGIRAFVKFLVSVVLSLVAAILK